MFDHEFRLRVLASLGRIEKFMAVLISKDQEMTDALTQLQTADTDLAKAVVANTQVTSDNAAEIKRLVGELTKPGVDPDTVAKIAADIEDAATAIGQNSAATQAAMQSAINADPNTPLAIDVSGLPEVGQVGVPYAGTVVVTGGVDPTSISISGLPDGLTASGASVTGTPTTAGDSTVSVSASDSSTPQKTASLTATISVAAAADTGTASTTASTSSKSKSSS